MIKSVMVSKALVVGAYQRKAELIAAQDVELTVFTPPEWGDRRGTTKLEQAHTQGYTLRALPVRINKNFHLHHYPTLYRELTKIRPDVLHMDEEPYNLATWLALRAARKLRIPALFFTWQNIHRRYPWPFCLFEQQNYRTAAHAIAGNQEAAQVLRQKGYQGPISVLPQFGVDPEFFTPRSPSNASHITIGYAGGLLAEKGLDTLLQACAGLKGDWRLEIVGKGDQLAALETLARDLQISERLTFRSRIASQAMPAFYQGLDLFVLPSRTLPNWKEQFGRVLIEAMACEVVVIGSNSGEIPNVIGEAGMVFPEGDVAQLRSQLQHLLDYPDERQRLAKLGRQRVLVHYSMAQIAQQTVDIYREILKVRDS
ncbi:MAG: glycosyltransferase [Caldilineaceae bacterium]